MVKKLITGLAISVGAGIALTATARHSRKVLYYPAKNSPAMAPVTIRVHTAATRPERFHPTPTAETPVTAESAPPSQAHSAELAEMRVMIESMDKRTGEMMSSVNQRIDDLQNHLPLFIDVKVSSRIREAEERLRTEFQDEQSKTLDAFLATLDSKILPRLSQVEEALGRQGEEIGNMRERMDHTDEAITRVVSRIEKVVNSVVAPPFPGYADSQVYSIDHRAVA
jgi:hypothetical protein